MTIATSIPLDPFLDQAPGQGQFTCSYRFRVYDFPTKTIVGEVYPIRDSTPVLSHDAERTIARQLSGLYFTPEDSALLDVIRHRIQVVMVLPDGTEYPLGTFMFIDEEGLLSTAGTSSDVTMVDEMFIVDQQIEQTYAAGTFAPDGSVVTFRQADDAIRDVLQGIPVNASLEPTPFYTIGVWAAGTNRGSGVIKELAIDGDYFSPWFSNNNVMTFIRAFDPATKIPAFEWSAHTTFPRPHRTPSPIAVLSFRRSSTGKSTTPAKPTLLPPTWDNGRRFSSASNSLPVPTRVMSHMTCFASTGSTGWKSPGNYR